MKVILPSPGRLQFVAAAILCCLFVLAVSAADLSGEAARPDLWALAKTSEAIHRFSTLFTAHDVRDRLSSEEGLTRAINWCKQTAVTKVYIEEFRDGYQAKCDALIRARDRFRAEGITTSGCITTTLLGKASGGWTSISCYTDAGTQEQVQANFEYAASLFDEIMIDDFWFTDCTCADCDAARLAQSIRVGEKILPVKSDSWEDYRSALMLQVSRERVLAAAERVNPKVQIIIKYPQWYDNFHERGYNVAQETAAFDTIWVGTESRDYKDSRWGGTVQFESYFIMRWLGGIGGAKCGGGWYDWLGTTEHTYIEQARQTILGGARESMLFCYGGLQSSTGPKDIAALRGNIPELLRVAAEVKKRQPYGIAAYKPASSHPGKESRVFDFVGMLGLPLTPCHEFPTNAPGAFFSVHALKDEQFAAKLAKFVAARKPVLLTDGLVCSLGSSIDTNQPNVQVLPVRGDPKSLLNLKETELEPLREPLLRALKTEFHAPEGVAIYLFNDGSWVTENFNDSPANVALNGQRFLLPARDWKYQWKP